ncbi:MAG: PEP-CTERM sorting domain-containing protein [Planctomycetaceae bacterium]
MTFQRSSAWRGAGALALVVVVALAAPAVQADTVVTSQLIGDFRPENPDNLFVDVTVTILDATPNVAKWVIDINSPSHPDIKLDAFFFNLALGGAGVAFGNFSPSATPGKMWSAVSGSNAVGSGSADFDFGVALTGSGSPQPNEVSNDVNLMFEMTLASGNWTLAMFTGAGFSTGGGIPPGFAQLGAHLQSLVMGPGNTTDSGFASGNWGPGGAPIPEPATLGLVGLAVLLVARRARRRQNTLS